MIFIVCQRVISFYYRAKPQMVARLRGHDRFFCHVHRIMVKKSDEFWHVLIRLPNGLLYDGGLGIHRDEKYSGKFDIEDMIEYDIELLEKRSYGLGREYPRYCPSFSIKTVEDLIEKNLNLIEVFNGEYGSRYRCYLNLLPSQVTASFGSKDRSNI